MPSVAEGSRGGGLLRVKIYSWTNAMDESQRAAKGATCAIRHGSSSATTCRDSRQWGVPARGSLQSIARGSRNHGQIRSTIVVPSGTVPEPALFRDARVTTVMYPTRTPDRGDGDICGIARDGTESATAVPAHSPSAGQARLDSAEFRRMAERRVHRPRRRLAGIR
jgi:hypothetical protein